VKGIAMHTPKWQKSSFSGMGADNDCLELAAFPHGLSLRESDDPALVLSSTPARWRAFLKAVQRDSFEVIGADLEG
jgi:hypothetical protein